ncbi:Uu.00g002780.m01.CDS01 [Anthostomella pinea]|uniref:Uu.00g002780.m01.CDS01 n=1 Tax=Anthostomella pinea TaxID=933095 RepID=A0AAI8VJP9_9PEZI|nr:Uu.00g002780.m01.CDS01 [Anthostomella pinea]
MSSQDFQKRMNGMAHRPQSKTSTTWTEYSGIDRGTSVSSKAPHIVNPQHHKFIAPNQMWKEVMGQDIAPPESRGQNPHALTANATDANGHVNGTEMKILPNGASSTKIPGIGDLKACKELFQQELFEVNTGRQVRPSANKPMRAPHPTPGLSKSRWATQGPSHRATQGPIQRAFHPAQKSVASIETTQGPTQRAFHDTQESLASIETLRPQQHVTVKRSQPVSRQPTEEFQQKAPVPTESAYVNPFRQGKVFEKKDVLPATFDMAAYESEQGNGDDHHSQQQESKGHASAKGFKQLPLTAEALVEVTGAPLEVKTKSIDILSQVSDDGIEMLNFDEDINGPEDRWDAERDFRGNFPDGIWENQEWNRTKRPTKKSLEAMSDDEEEFVIPPYLEDYVNNWNAKTTECETDFLTIGVENHEDCDVDTLTGILMQPIDYPETKPDPSIPQSSKQSKTSQMAMAAREAHLDRTDPERKLKRKLAVAAKRKAAADAAKAEKAAADAREKAFLEELHAPNPHEVKVPCHLRPAVESDMPGVAAIYNKEIDEGWRVIDAGKVSPDRFRQLFNGCREEKMPFVVALEGWHDPNITDNRVIGFAFIDAISRGIMGAYSTHSRPGGRLTVVVDSEFRRKKVGTALIDVVMTACSTRYLPKLGHQFVNPLQNRTTMRPEYNSRYWWYIDMVVHIKSEKTEKMTRQGDEFKWIWDWLESTFVLILIDYDEKCLKDQRQPRGEWLDRLTFRHVCRALGP